LRAALFERRIVEECIGPRGEHFVCERRRLRQVAAHKANVAREQTRQQFLEAAEVHRFVEAVIDGLDDQRMIGDLALATRFSAQAT
jgi:hypothetical protein